MSYGNYIIYEDLKTMSVSKVVEILRRYYPDIPKYRAIKLVKFVKDYGPDAPNKYWKTPASEEMWAKRLLE